MTSTMTTIALVLMGALTANASNLRLTASNSSATSIEFSSSEMSLDAAGKATYYASTAAACGACQQHGYDSSGHSHLENSMGRHCVCLAYTATTAVGGLGYKMHCAAQAQDLKGAFVNATDGTAQYKATDATNVIAGKSGCKCKNTVTKSCVKSWSVNVCVDVPHWSCPASSVPAVTLPRRRRSSYSAASGR